MSWKTKYEACMYGTSAILQHSLLTILHPNLQQPFECQLHDNVGFFCILTQNKWGNAALLEEAPTFLYALVVQCLVMPVMPSGSAEYNQYTLGIISLRQNSDSYLLKSVGRVVPFSPTMNQWTRNYEINKETSSIPGDSHKMTKED